MNKNFHAEIRWLSAKQGGRQTGIPFSDKYAPIINIKDNPYSEHNANWSVFVNNIEQISDLVTIAEIHYLSDMAPDNLKKDLKFELYEGNKLVALGIIL